MVGLRALVTTACLSLAGCDTWDTSQADAPGASVQEEGLRADAAGGAAATRELELHQSMCPLLLPGVSIDVVDIDEGVALDFIASSEDDIAAVRARVEAMATHVERILTNDASSGSRGRGPGSPPPYEEPEHPCFAPDGAVWSAGSCPGATGHEAGGGCLRRDGGECAWMRSTEVRALHVRGGARLAFRARPGTELSELRALARRHADGMRARRECPVLLGGPEQG